MSFEVIVVYALADRLIQEAYNIEENTTVKQLLHTFSLNHPELALDIDQLKCGVYSERKQQHDTLQPNDRLEIYRELLQDPKVRRRNKVRKKT